MTTKKHEQFLNYSNDCTLTNENFWQGLDPKKLNCKF